MRMSKESENRRLMKGAGANDLLNKAEPVEQLFDAYGYQLIMAPQRRLSGEQKSVEELPAL